MKKPRSKPGLGKAKPANDRGFLRIDWVDRYGAECSLQESSLGLDILFQRKCC